MAIITWMNTPIPDPGSTQQQGFRTAADLLANAVRSASQGVGQVQAVEEAQRASEVQAADRFVLENMLSTRDPTRYDQMRADGSLLGPAALRASNATLVAAEGRSNDLYNLDRTRTRNSELQAAEALLDRAAPVAVNNPEEALRIMGQARFTNAEDQVEFDKKVRDLFVPRGGGPTEASRKEALNLEAMSLVDQVVALGANNPGAASRKLMNHPRADVRAMAVDRLKQVGYPVQEIYGVQQRMDPLNSIVTGSGALTNKIYDGPEEAQFRQFGNQLQMGMAAAGPSRPPPGTPEWSRMNGGRVPTQADVWDWQDSFVLPESERQRGEGRGTTAIGPYQITNRTRMDIINRFGKQLFGTDDSSKIPFTLENEDKIAEQVYKTQTARAWEATQDYPGLRDLRAFKGRSWEEAKPLLSYIDGGVAPRSFGPETNQIEARLRERELALTEGQKVILNAEPNKSWGLAEASDDLAKFVGKEVRPGEVRALIEKTVRQAKDAGTVITHAEAVGLIKNAINDDASWNISDLSKDLDVEDSKLVQEAKDLGNARADLKSFKQDQEAFKRVQELRDAYRKDAVEADSALAQAKRFPDAGESALVAFRKWQDTSDRLRKLVAPTARARVDRSQVGGLTPTGPAPQSLANPPRRPDIDLMLDPPQSPVTPPAWGSSSFLTR